MTTVDPAQNPKNAASESFFKPSTLGGGKPLETLTPPDARAVLVNAQASVSLELPPCDIEHKTVTQDGLNVDLTVVRPFGSQSVLPSLYVHPRWWLNLGDFPTHERFVRDLVVDSGFVAAFVNYLPSPEAKYPTAINQAYAATKRVVEHGSMSTQRKHENNEELPTIIKD